VALQPRDPVEHHDDHGEGHGDEHEEKEESTEDEPAEESSKDEEKSEEGGEEKASPDDAEKEEAPKEEDKESQEEGEKKDSEESEVSNKGMTKSASNTVKHEETSTGKKLRLDSTAGTNVGEGVSSGEGDAMAKKQSGFSNTDTRHSTDLSKNPEKSQKGEGTVETAKVKGTIDPNRPQV
jgi:hypothetical protein